MIYIHKCHSRDIKIENVLYSNGKYKLCDFGSCTTAIYQSGQLSLASEIRKIEQEIDKTTTLPYRAPELCDLYQKKAMDEKMDIWVSFTWNASHESYEF